MGEWLDVTRPIRTGMPHWPGDPDVVVERILDLERGDSCNVSRLELCTHSGTHMDAPLHYIPNGLPIDQFPPEVAIGPARVLQIADPECVREEDLRRFEIHAGERVLFRTKSSELNFDQPFREDFVYISAGAAEYLAARRVLLVGVDYMSVGGYHKDGIETHQALLGANIWLVENLDLQKTPEGEYEMICLPLRIAGGDGAPCRVLLRRA